MSLVSQRGRVVLINVWTFGCINCMRTLPWVRSVDERYGGKGVTVIGVHSPEFDREKDSRAVDAARAREKLRYSSFLDADHRYWKALDNHYWPTVYLIDGTGVIRDAQVGEIHIGDATALRLEREIGELMAEP